MTVDFLNPEKCETCGHCVTSGDVVPALDMDGEPVTDDAPPVHDCLVYGGRPLRVRPDGYCVMWKPREVD